MITFKEKRLKNKIDFSKKEEIFTIYFYFEICDETITTKMVIPGMDKLRLFWEAFVSLGKAYSGYFHRIGFMVPVSSVKFGFVSPFSKFSWCEVSIRIFHQWSRLEFPNEVWLFQCQYALFDTGLALSSRHVTFEKTLVFPMKPEEGRSTPVSVWFVQLWIMFLLGKVKSR